jgi:hypothetical protein
MAFISGPYTATFDASALGQVEVGWTLRHSTFQRLITGHNFAQTPQDAIFQGMQMFIDYRLIEYNAAGVLKAMWPFGTTHLNVATPVGAQAVGSSKIKQLILTAVAGTPAATVPATLTLPRCILAEGFNVELLYAPDLRIVPISQRVFPDSSGVFGTET